MPTNADSAILVEEVLIEFTWNPGMAPSQKQKNVAALHEAACSRGLGPVLEISSKSLTALGVELSAFNLTLETTTLGQVTVEAAFQGSKVFAHGGPHPDMFQLAGRDLKRDPRLTRSGPLVAFEWEGERWSLEPRTAFYDWLYISALRQTGEAEGPLAVYRSFTDIEFNPSKSVNCQARSCALFVALHERDVDMDVIRERRDFIDAAYPFGIPPGANGQSSRFESA